MENSTKFTRPDVINLVLIVLLGIMQAIHVVKSQGNHELIAKQEAQHVSAISAELKALKTQIQELKAKNGTASN
jgi:hypothetical protein